MCMVKALAKINLFLYVTGRRENGYHDLLTLMVCIDLHDEMTFEFHQPETTVTCSHPHVPEDESNLAFRAVKLFYENYKKLSSAKDESFFFVKNKLTKRGASAPFSAPLKEWKEGGGEERYRHAGVPSCTSGVAITIEKNIPVGAGLGGGSSNAAVVLKTMNLFYGQPFSKLELMQFGAEIGSDVPFFIQGGSALAQSLGEKLTPCLLTSPPLDISSQAHSLRTPPPLILSPLMPSPLRPSPLIPSLLAANADTPGYLLLFYPGIEASTAEVYKNLDLGLTKPVKFNINSLLRTSGDNRMLNIEMLDIEGIMHNDLETSTCILYPEIELFKKELADCVPERVMMTGSGSTFFSLFSDCAKAERCFDELSIQWKNTHKKIFLTSFAEIEKCI